MITSTSIAQHTNERIRIVPRAAMTKGEWDRLVETSDEAWLWHLYEFQAALATWPHTYDYSVALVDTHRNEQMLGLYPLRLVRDRPVPMVSYAQLDSLGGLALRNDLPEGTRRAAHRAVAQYATSLARELRAIEWRVTLPSLAPALRGANTPRVNPLLTEGFANTLGQTWIVDLKREKNELWQRLEGRTRTAIRKAEKRGVAIRRASTTADLDMYYALHVETYRRTGAKPRPKAYFATVWESLLPSGHARVYVAEIDGTPIAALNIGTYKNAAIYWTGASSALALDSGSNHLLQWNAISDLKDANFEWYDVGEAFPGTVSGKSGGLDAFKRSFGGELYPTYRGRIAFRKLYFGARELVKALRGS